MAKSHDAIEIARAISSGQTTAEAVCAQAIERIESLDSPLNAFVELTAEYALQRARQVDYARTAGKTLGPLAGVPIAVKDNICTIAGRTTCGCRMLSEYRSPYDATVIRRIEDAGGIIIGKTNLDEFGLGSSTENSAFEPTRNPWDTERVPGGSSGGSAVAIAAGMIPLALGSDTGGSIRQPAAFCGVVGLKPTYGRVSRFGLVAYGSSLDQIGPLAGSVSDAALLLSVIGGHDEHDSTSLNCPLDDCLQALADQSLTHCADGLRIGLPKEYFGDGLDDEVRKAIEAAVALYQKLGAKIVDVTLPHSSYCVAVYYLLAAAECSSNLARFDGVHYGRRAAAAADIFELCAASRGEGFGAEVKRRIMLGTFVLSAGYYDAYYEKALKARQLIRADFERAFEQVDVLACPTTPTTAFRIGEKLDDPLQMVPGGYLYDRGESRRHTGDLYSMRIFRRGITDRLTITRTTAA